MDRALSRSAAVMSEVAVAMVLLVKWANDMASTIARATTRAHMQVSARVGWGHASAAKGQSPVEHGQQWLWRARAVDVDVRGS